MTARLPVVFVSHGAPDALIKAPSALQCWQEIGAAIPRPTSILALSPHWEASVPTLGLNPQRATIHDFSGFPKALYAFQYPAPSAPELIVKVTERFAEAGMALQHNNTRGLDHGAWVPLLGMFPEADIPVAQLALPHLGTPADFLALGTALRPLRDTGVLIIASGAITHNFSWLNWSEAESSQPLPRAKAFADWVGERIQNNEYDALIDYRNAPWGSEAHPSEEHFLPLFAALGAAGKDAVQRHQPAFSYGGLAMDCYVWS